MGILDWLKGRLGNPGSSNSSQRKSMFKNIRGEEALEKVNGGNPLVLDVRTEQEFAKSHIPGATLIPLQQLPGRCQELDASREILVICAGGVRSTQACKFLSQQGFTNLHNVIGGMSSYPGPKESSNI
jgi:rhodanese-related sulfurtransferase